MPGLKHATSRWLEALPLIYLLAGLAWILGSDLVAGWLNRDDHRAVVSASTLKGAVFVVLTAALLYILVAIRRADFAPGPRALGSFELRKPLIAFALVALGIASTGYFVYLLEVDGVRARASRQLESTAELAATEFALWHEARVRSMRQVADSPLTARSMGEWQASRSDLVESLLREQLEAIRASHDYASVAAVAVDGTILLAVGRSLQMTPATRKEVGSAIATKRVISHWVSVENADGSRQPVVDLLVALREGIAGQEHVAAVIIARADIPWPPRAAATNVAAPNSTVMLARIDGDQVGFVEQGIGGAPHYALMPLAQADLSVVRAVLREQTMFAARDPADRAVLATGRAVVATPWFAVTSMETSAIEQQIQQLTLLIVGISVLGLLATAALVLPWWRSLQAGANAFARRVDSRADEMATRLGWVTRHANDVILLIAQDGQILDANDRAEQVYGYSREELLSLKVFSLRPVDATRVAEASARFEAVTQDGSPAFEAIHVRKDGTTFPVEVSSRKVVLGDQQYVQSIVRDISDRRRAIESLRESEAQYRLLFRANPHPMWVYDVETLRFLAVNDAAIEHYGFSETEFLDMTIADIRPDEERARLEAVVHGDEDDLLQRTGVWRHRLKDHTVIDVEVTSDKINFRDRQARLVLASDVTSRMLGERALRASEERYRGLFENASDGILLIGMNCRVLAANTEYQVMLGYSLEELLSMDLALLLDEREQARLEIGVPSLRHGQPPAPATWIHRRKDGSSFSGEVRMRTLPGGNQLATVRDLTEIIAARRRIERQRDLYSLLSQCNQAIARVHDPQVLLHSVPRLAVERGRFLFAWIGEVNEAGQIVPTATYGDDRGHIAGLHLTIDPATPEGTAPSSRAVRGGRLVIANNFLTDPSTAPWHEAARVCGIGASAAFPIRTGGRITAALMLYAADASYFDAEIVATLEEMTTEISHALDALRTRRELDENRLLLQSLINASDALVFAFDREGRAILMNDASARAMGGVRASLIGCRRDSVMPAATARAHEINDRRVFDSGEHIVVEERNTESGSERVYLSFKYPLKDVEGRVYAVGGVSTDITELRRIQQELAEANRSLEEKVAERTREAMDALARAEAADRAKTVFLSSMSHELRSPLHSIIGFTSVLLEGLEGELTPAQQEHLRVVSEASHHLLAIINDLLDMSRIEAGAVALEIRPLSIRLLLERIINRFKLQAREKGLELRLEPLDPDIGISGDERRIEQIVSNLVSNAIKYTSSGEVVVGCRREAGKLRIEVRDTGQGIAAEDQQQLFIRFAQLKPAPGSLTQGAGLGLAIAAGLAEAMGGEIVLQSETDVGSVFSLLLPLEHQGNRA